MSTDGVCGSSKSSLLTHFDRDANRPTDVSLGGRSRREIEDVLERDSHRFDKMVANTGFNQFQDKNASINLSDLAEHLPIPSMPPAVHPYNASSASGALNAYRYQRNAPMAPGPPASAASRMGLSHSWVDQFSSRQTHPYQQSSSNVIQYPGSRSTYDHVNHRHFPSMYGAPQQLSMATTAAIPSAPTFREPPVAASSANPQAEFDNAFKGWMDSMGADESRLWDNIEYPMAAAAQVPAPAPQTTFTRPSVPVEARGQEPAIQHQEQVQNGEDAKLAIAAQEIINSVAEDRSSKFQQSEFLNLMRRIASMDLVVRDNALVNPDTLEPKSFESATTAKESRVNPKQATVEDGE